MDGELCRLPLLICRPVSWHTGQPRGLGLLLGAAPLVGVRRLTIHRDRDRRLHLLGMVSSVVHYLTFFY